MTIVTHHPDDSAGTTLMKFEQELKIQHPHLPLEQVRHLVREAHPGLWALHHAGLPSAPPAAVDPGILLNNRAHALLRAGTARTFTEATRMAHQELPEAAAAYQACKMLPADQAPRQHQASEPPRRSSDAGQELMRLVVEKMAADATLTVGMAQKAVLAADPVLASHYSQAKPLPIGSWPTRSDLLMREIAAGLQRHREELAEVKRMFAPPDRRHFSELTEAEKRRALPERRLLPGDRLRPGEVQVEKMGTPVTGGGSFAVAAP